MPVNEYDLCHELLFSVRRLGSDTVRGKLWEALGTKRRDELGMSGICAEGTGGCFAVPLLLVVVTGSGQLHCAGWNLSAFKGHWEKMRHSD